MQILSRFISVSLGLVGALGAILGAWMALGVAGNASRAGDTDADTLALVIAMTPCAGLFAGGLALAGLSACVWLLGDIAAARAPRLSPHR